MTPTPTLDLQALAARYVSEPLIDRAELTDRHRELRARLAQTTATTDVGAGATVLLVTGVHIAPPGLLYRRDGYDIGPDGMIFDLSDLDDIAPGWRDNYAAFLDRLFAAAARTRGRRHTVTLIHPTSTSN